MRKLVLVPLLLSVVFVVGCEHDTLSFMIPAEVSEGITVTGSGSATGTPDVAILSLGVSVERKTVQEATDDAAQAMNEVIDSLKNNGVADKDIQTTQFSVGPRYDWIDNRQVLRGYNVTNIVAAKIRDMNRVGSIIDDAVAAGGDLLVVNSVSFSIDDPTSLQEEARIKAMKDAQSRAETLANEAGVKLGKPRIIEDVAYSGQPRYSYDYEKAAADNTPIQPGELEVTVTVRVIFDIED